MFINASFAATRQCEYYTDRREQSVSIDFLHQYILANYRRLYARALAAGINHFNQALIVTNLLAAGAPAGAAQRAEEGELIEPKMTAAEKLRFQSSAARTPGARLDFDLGRAPVKRVWRNR